MKPIPPRIDNFTHHPPSRHLLKPCYYSPRSHKPTPKHNPLPTFNRFSSDSKCSASTIEMWHQQHWWDFATMLITWRIVVPHLALQCVHMLEIRDSCRLLSNFWAASQMCVACWLVWYQLRVCMSRYRNQQVELSERLFTVVTFFNLRWLGQLID